MKIKEKVLKEIMESERYKEFQDWLTAKWFSEKSIDLTLAKVGKEIIEAYKKCYNGWLDIKNQKPRENNTPRDWEQRMDELVLLYCQLRELNYGDAKKELKQKLGIK